MSTRFLAASGRDVRVKFCGITRREDAISAAEMGVDAIGLVFYEPSPRAVTISQAVDIIAWLPPEVTVTGLFVDAPEQYIRQVLASVPLHLLQFHGSEPVSACDIYQLPYMKALKPDRQRPETEDASQYTGAFGILWDTYDDHVPGGSGRCGDWGRLSGLMSHYRNILAGGLTPDNVVSAIEATQPYAVDVSSGIEENPGIKSRERMLNFMQEVCNAS